MHGSCRCDRSSNRFYTNETRAKTAVVGSRVSFRADSGAPRRNASHASTNGHVPRALQRIDVPFAAGFGEETSLAEQDQDDARYKVVINHEEQYSIWRDDGRELPPGWREVGTSGSKQECLDHIEKVWTDMRPRSVRERMKAARK